MENFEELGEGYIPEKIFFRDEEMGLLNKVVDNFEKGGEIARSLNILGLGGTGTGKTAMIKKIMKDRGENKFLYLTIGTGWTLNQILRGILDKDYSTTARLLHEVKEELKRNPKILVFDEVNRLKDNKQLSLFLEALNEIWRETEIPIIVLTNIFNIKEHQKDDGKSSLSFRPIYLRVYSAEQLEQIFTDRLKNFKKDYNIFIPESGIYNVSLVVAQEGDGSARQVRKIILQCCIENNFDMKFIEELVRGVMDEDMSEMLMRINEREKRFFYDLYKIYENRKKLGQLYFTSRDIENFYSKFENPISIRTIQNYINVAETYGIIKTDDRNRGRGYGRSRLVYFQEQYFLNNKKFLNGQDISPNFNELPEIKEIEQQRKLVV